MGRVKPLPIVQPSAAGPAPLVFERIGIVGLGLIGGSLALACRATWPRALVIGVDRNDVIEQAVVRHAIDVAADDLGLLAEAQLIVLAAPVRANCALLATLGDHVRGDAIVTDVSSTKRAVVDAARKLPARLAFIGGHPFAGAARRGIEFGSAELFKGRPWFLTSEALTPAGVIEQVSAFVAALGAVPRLMAAEAHDELLAMVSHVPQLVASALMSVVGDAVGEEGLALSGRGLRDTTRLSSSAAEVWTDVTTTNADAIAPALDSLIEVLTALRSDLHEGTRLEDVFRRAQHWRGLLDQHVAR
jgi:prephenate dehydrogenase